MSSVDQLCTWQDEYVKGAFQFIVAAVNAIGLEKSSDVSEEITLKG